MIKTASFQIQLFKNFRLKTVLTCLKMFKNKYVICQNKQNDRNLIIVIALRF